jgi:hypothetical protein
MLPMQQIRNPPKLGQFLTHMYMNVTERSANITTLKSTPKINLIWGLKVLDMCQPIINPDMTILI